MTKNFSGKGRKTKPFQKLNAGSSTSRPAMPEVPAARGATTWRNRADDIGAQRRKNKNRRVKTGKENSFR